MLSFSKAAKETDIPGKSRFRWVAASDSHMLLHLPSPVNFIKTRVGNFQIQCWKVPEYREITHPVSLNDLICM